MNKPATNHKPYLRAMLMLLLLLTVISAAGQGRAGELDRLEAQSLDRYLDQLASGGAADAKLVDALADVSWPAVEKIIRRYVELRDPIEPHTHRAFQALLERITRTASQPWLLVETYSPEFATFLNSPVAENQLSANLFERLLKSAPERRTWDLLVRLCPESSLAFLARAAESQHADLFEAWNRRLARGRISQPIPQLGEHLDRVAKAPHDESSRLMEAKLEFLGHWKQTRAEYERRLDVGLQSEDRSKVLASLRVQIKIPACLNSNERLIGRDDEITVLALQGYAADADHDHSAVLRKVWPVLPPAPSKARYHALLAMSVHPTGNQIIALEALRQQPFEFLDATLGVLRTGDEAAARSAVEFLLNQSTRGHEEALRLAITRNLKGFEQPAIRLALDNQREAIARQTALQYLQLADGASRRKVLTLLTHRNADVRLAAIQTFGPPTGLTAADRDDIGPALIQVAKEDTSEGHRQEAIFSLGLWSDPQAAPFFREMLKQNPPIILADEPYNNEQYWRYRYRLVALTGLARLNDAVARDELVQLHHRGGPTEKMDVLLALLSLKQCLPWVINDLESDEPKLIATAVRVLLDYGSSERKKTLRGYFARTPVWQQFRDSGIDDHGLLGMVGSEE